MDTNTFADVRDFLVTSVSRRLSKESGSILLNTRFKAKNNITTAPYKRCTYCCNWISINSQEMALISVMIKREKVSSYMTHVAPSMIGSRYHIGSKKEVKPH